MVGYYNLLIIVPLLIIIRNIYYFFTKRKEYLYKSIILRTIKNTSNIKNKNLIRKSVSNISNVDSKIKTIVMQNITQLISEIQKEEKPLIVKDRGYRLTMRGAKMLAYYERVLSSQIKLKFRLRNKELSNEIPVWTERDLKKLKRLRG